MMEYGQRIVSEIPVTIRMNKTEIARKENVTFYARVSTDRDEQEESYERQKEHFEEVIKARKDWNYVEGYADQGITGTHDDSRPEFMRMINDCLAGKIDRILVKSISRFARNTVDTLNNIRMLKERGISVVFETQGIDTLTPNGEVLITILAAIAEQESRTISTNIKWSYQKRFRDGRVLMSSKTLGYKKDGDGYAVVEKEAEMVRFIFRSYLAGKSVRQIANELNSKGCKTKNNCNFSASGILGILSNEKYTGNAILGKTYKPDVLSKKRLKNEGQEKRYYVEFSHPQIISKEIFDAVQKQKQDRTTLRSNANTGRGKYSSKYPFSGLLVCGECGSKFRRAARNIKENKTVTWICIEHQKDKNKCSLKAIKENDVYNAYNRMIETLCGDLSEVVQDVKRVIEDEMKNEICEDLTPIQERIKEIRKNVLEVFKQRNTNQISEEEYQARYSILSEEMKNLENKYSQANIRNIDQQLHKDRLNEIISVLETEGTNYNDPAVLRKLVDTIVVKDQHTLEFQLACGINIQEQI